ncbi:hypothetical protein ACW2QC_09295 [Virgibacillus sp. FSP13]
MISKVRDKDINKLLKLCMDKEQRGFECIVPIQKKTSERKHFKRGQFGKQEYIDTDYETYYEAVYKQVE